MENILNQLARHAKERVEIQRDEIPLKMMKLLAKNHVSKLENFAFEKALSGEGIHFICECKKASPSKGIITENFPYLEIAREYERAGADAISVLTEPKWFLGADKYLSEIANAVNIPVLRKDFTVDEYMIYQAKALGASAVLLIVAILEEGQLRDYIALSEALGMSALVEAHDLAEIEIALKCDARIIGINNRNLKDFSVDVANSVSLRNYVPKEILFVAESGIKDRQEIDVLEKNGVNAVLIGEAMMKAIDKKEMLYSLKYGECLV